MSDEKLDDLPKWLPDECREAIDQLMEERVIRGSEDELLRIVSDLRLNKFWHEARTYFTSHWEKEGIPGGQNVGGLNEYFRRLIYLMVVKGGKLPTRSLAEKQKERERIAKKIRQLQALILHDDSLREVGFSDLANICNEFEDVGFRRIGGADAQNIFQTYTQPESAADQGIENQESAADQGIEHQELTAELSLIMLGPKLPDIFEALAVILEEGKIVHPYDKLQYDDDVPQPGRPNKNQIYAERKLNEFFRTYTGANRYDLVAVAIEVALNTSESVITGDVGSRDRMYRSRRP